MKRLAVIAFVFWIVPGSLARAGYFDCSVVYDEFESLMNKQFLVEPDRYVTTVSERITVAEYQRLQRGQFILHEDRAGAGIIIFRTNENLHGKLLYRFDESLGNEVHLLIDEVVIYARIADGYAPARYGPIRVKPKFGLDLDTGESFVLLEEGSVRADGRDHKRADLSYRIDAETGAFVIEAANEATLNFPTESLCHRPGGARPGPGTDSPVKTPSPARSMPLPPSPPVSGGAPASRSVGQP